MATHLLDWIHACDLAAPTAFGTMGGNYRRAYSRFDIARAFSSNVIRILACVVDSIGESFVDSKVNNTNNKMYARLANNPSVTHSLATIVNIGVRAPRYNEKES